MRRHSLTVCQYLATSLTVLQSLIYGAIALTTMHPENNSCTIHRKCNLFPNSEVLNKNRSHGLTRDKRYSFGNTKGDLEQKVISSLTENYDWRVRPSGKRTQGIDGGPVDVEVNMYLRTISKIDDVNMEYSAHFTFREKWFDPRLEFETKNELGLAVKYVHLPPSDPNISIWMPDTFFQNEKDGRKHMIDKPNVLLRVYPTGQILYSIRMTLTLSCPMSLQNYPLDTQECYIDLASYAYTTDDIEYHWKSDNPIQVKAGLKQSLPSFTLTDVRTTLCTSKTNTGVYSCLRTVLVLKREFSYYLLQLYIPSLMLVAVSWVSFWLDKDSVPARVTLGVTTLLTMTTQASGINAKLPPVSYTKAIDVWIGVCLAFIFGALLEFALVNYAARKDLMDEIRCRKNDNYESANSYAAPMIQTRPPSVRPVLEDFEWETTMRGRNRIIARRPRRTVVNRPGFFTWFKRKYSARSKRIDVLARFTFPISFGLFNALYWITYMVPYVRVQPNTEILK